MSKLIRKRINRLINKEAKRFIKHHSLKKAKIPMTIDDLCDALLDVRIFLSKMDRSYRLNSSVTLAREIISELTKGKEKQNHYYF